MKNIWDTREYGLSKPWVKRASTVMGDNGNNFM